MSVIVITFLLLLSVIVCALFVRLGAHWAKVPASHSGRGRIIATAALLVVLPVALWLGVKLAGLGPEPAGAPARFPDFEAGAEQTRQLFLLAAFSGLYLLLIFTITRLMLKTGVKQTFQVVVAVIGGNLLLSVPTQLLVKPFLVEAFVTSSNAMAPTVLGPHRSVTCSRCGGQAFCGVEPRGRREPEAATTLVICSRCHRTSQVSNLPSPVSPADRILVDKLSKARRWDVVTYKYPEDPEVIYLSRLVGFPGELVTIRDGSLWIDGQKQALPSRLEGLVYDPQPGLDLLPPASATDEKAEWQLEADEYFVLSDFSSRARDSRTWSEGAPSHSPWAVPRSHLVGVATYIYWPPSRWRDLRAK